MRWAALRFIVITGVIFFSPQPRADIINGGFEDGLTGWSRLGPVGVRSTVGPHAPTEGTLQGALESQTLGFTDEAISAALGIPRITVANPFEPGKLVNTTIFELLRQDDRVEDGQDEPLTGCLLSDDCLTDGSAVLYQSFDVIAGQRLTFDWNLLGSADQSFGIPADSAFVTLSTPGNLTAILLSDTYGSVLPIDPGFADIVGLICVDPKPDFCDVLNVPRTIAGATGYQSIALEIASSGTATLGISLINSGGPGPSAGLLVDNFQLVSVPEPGTLALLGVSLVGMNLARRRKEA